MSEKTSPKTREMWVQAAVVTLVALILRVIYLAQIKSWPFFYHPILDAKSQYEWAVAIIQSPFWIGNETVIAKAPLYSYFLASCVWLFGEGRSALFAAHLLQLLLGAASCGLIYLIGRKSFGATTGLMAGGLAAVFAPEIFNEGELLDTALTVFLSAAFLLALLASLERPTRGQWLGTGVLLGLLGITRPNLLVLGLVALWLVLRRVSQEEAQGERRSLVLALLAGVALIILPITVRNAILTAEFVPIATNGGINFYTGNSPNADGYSPIPAGVAWERSWYAWRHLGRLSANQQDQFYRAQALAFWRQHPGQALALTAKKLYLYWNAYDVPNNLSFYWGRAHASLLRMAPLGFGLIGVLGLLGLAWGARRSRETEALSLSVIAIMLSIVTVFVAGRYRAAMLPALFPFAGFAVVELTRTIRERRKAALPWLAFGLLGFGLLVNSDLYGVARARGANRDFFYLGQCYDLQGDHARARDALLQAARANPKDADAWAFAAAQELSLGEPAAAAEHLRRALNVAPDYARAAGWLANATLEQHWPVGDARRRLERALSLQTENVEARVALLRINLAEGDRAAATRNAAHLVDSFSHHTPYATNYEQLQSQVMTVLSQAQSQGIPIPPLEQGSPSGSQMPLGQ